MLANTLRKKSSRKRAEGRGSKTLFSSIFKNAQSMMRWFGVKVARFKNIAEQIGGQPFPRERSVGSFNIAGIIMQSKQKHPTDLTLVGVSAIKIPENARFIQACQEQNRSRNQNQRFQSSARDAWERRSRSH